MFKREGTYDLIMSLGAACNCTEALRHLHLQNRSYPFDWIFGSNLSDRVTLLKNRFENWFNIEDFCYLRTEENKVLLQNNKTDLIYNHDFFTNKGAVEDQFPIVKAKYDRRINRILNMFDSKEKTKILLVYFQRPIKQPDNWEEYSEYDLNLLIEDLENVFPCSEFNILFVASKDRMYSNKIKYIKCKKNKIMMASTYNRYRNAYESSLQKFNLIKILKHYHIKYKYCDYTNIVTSKIKKFCLLFKLVF